jgi:hypothetical protein
VAVVILHVHKYGGGVTRKFKSEGLHESHVVAERHVSDQYNTINAVTLIYSSRTKHVLAIIRRYNNIKGKTRQRPLHYITIHPEIIILLYKKRNNKIF